METTQIKLAEYLDCDLDDMELESYDHYGMELYSYGSSEYAIGTDQEAEDAVMEYIKDSIWTFNASFLSEQTGLPEGMFSFASEQCEGVNDAILQVVKQSCGLNSFVEKAICYDGRGHFLSSYDGNENEVGEFYVYRVN